LAILILRKEGRAHGEPKSVRLKFREAGTPETGETAGDCPSTLSKGDKGAEMFFHNGNIGAVISS